MTMAPTSLFSLSIGTARPVRAPAPSTVATRRGSRSRYACSAFKSATWTTRLVLARRPRPVAGPAENGPRFKKSVRMDGAACTAATQKRSPSIDKQVTEFCFTEPARVGQNSLKDGLKIAWRTGDRAEYLGGRRLLLQRLGKVPPHLGELTG